MTATCPYCGHQGRMRRRAKGSILVGLILLLCYVLPGVLYLYFTAGYRYYCPRCRNRLDLA